MIDLLERNQIIIDRADCKSDKDYLNKQEFFNIISDLIFTEPVQQMKNYRQHFNSSCFDHCLEVSYWSFIICKKLHLDYVSMARAALLHDLFLYDWRGSKKKLHLKRLHAFIHPYIALQNAQKICNINEKEQDIILKHMWPVTFFQFPKYRESFIITITDKLSSLNSFRKYILKKEEKSFLKYQKKLDS